MYDGLSNATLFGVISIDGYRVAQPILRPVGAIRELPPQNDERLKSAHFCLQHFAGIIRQP